MDQMCDVNNNVVRQSKMVLGLATPNGSWIWKLRRMHYDKGDWMLKS